MPVQSRIILASLIVAMILIWALGGMAMWKLSATGAKEVVILAINAIASMTTGGAGGFVLGRTLKKKNDKEPKKPDG